MFVSEKTAPKFQKITVEQAKRLVLQRDIDQESLPRQPVKSLTSQRSVAVERPVEKVKMKVEEDKRGENHIKKEKKHKALGQASVLENKNCNVDVGSLADGKKEKKKSKKVETEEEPRDVSGGKKEKKKKRKIVNESQNDANAKDAKDEGVSKKKKKQQQLADDINQMEIAQISVKEDVEKKQRKKKVKNKTVQIIGENVNIQKEEEEVQQAGKDEVPKKAKKVKNKIAVSTEEQSKEKKRKKTKSTEEETTAAIDGITVRKKKPRVGKNEGTLETLEGETEVEEVKKKKRTKKEAKFKEDENGVEKPEIKGKKKKSKAASGKVESEIVIVEEKTEQRKKGKKEKYRKASVEVSEVEETEPKKKKKKKENKKGKEEPLLIKCEENEENGLSRETPVAVEGDGTSKKSKKKKSSVQAENNFRVESGTKKKRKIKGEVEDQQESSQEDVVFLSERCGNTDEIFISQGRRQALQMEIDKASQPEKPAKPSGLGQWSTAQFNSSEQQQKFLRLMGGFKKGFQPAASTGGGNMAMGKDAQQQLQQGLLGEFERAHSRRMDFSNRGAGLGFTAPSNKKFSIDVNACRSVRFDD
ncbi:lysine-rich nucleolar protein 1 [Toxotes jaculatrix]|uniref:lysine-rich nucleolar protein 1 n=1 Tax=Toxotes jaculatrix TaxID=941984 RepID=UPI001B3A7E39|nr:lysine-rich nucleolar protein 1 [Toxotes jaculatrix]XP_040892283.1 lysine-rich nucleolar protein 1 [Toxotes jaculatrix]